MAEAFEVCPEDCRWQFRNVLFCHPVQKEEFWGTGIGYATTESLDHVFQEVFPESNTDFCSAINFTSMSY